MVNWEAFLCVVLGERSAWLATHDWEALICTQSSTRKALAMH
jgi:hypothetical protein